MRRPFVVGNWKMNTGRDDAIALARAIAREAERGDVEVAVCPPHPWIVSVAESVDRATLRIGAQDCSANDDGPFTGDVSAAMLAPWCDLVLIGHSERRSVHGETDELIRHKLRAAIAHGLDPVLCVGEHLEDRAAGDATSFVTGQLDGALSNFSASAFAFLTIAYEPVWAIGTGVSANPNDASEMAGGIRAWLWKRAPDHVDRIRILYGGSVSDGSAAGLMALAGLDGLLVGSASLDAGSFGRIIAAASGR